MLRMLSAAANEIGKKGWDVGAFCPNPVLPSRPEGSSASFPNFPIDFFLQVLYSCITYSCYYIYQA